MELERIKNFCTERLGENLSLCAIEDLQMPVRLDKDCAMVTKHVVICKVYNEAKALNSLWRFATEGLPMLFVSSQRSIPLLMKDMYAEVFGSSVDELDLHDSTALKHVGAFFEDFADAKIYINDSAKNLQAKCIRELLLSKEVKLIVTDLQQ